MSMWLFLSLFLCAYGDRAQSQALLQSSAQRKRPEPRLLGPSHFLPRKRPGFPMDPMMQLRMRRPRVNRSSMLKVDESSMYGSSYGTTAPLTPCQSPSSFDPAIEIWGYCDTYMLHPQPAEAACTSAGCRFSWGYCYCEDKDGCMAIGGQWDSHTCADELEYLMPTLEEAERTGSCAPQEPWSTWGPADMVAYPAAECCADYPNTYCDHDQQSMTPCVDSADFLPEAFSWVYCDLWDSPPTTAQCEAQAGCKEEWGYCNCKTKESCAALGGYFQGGKCHVGFTLGSL